MQDKHPLIANRQSQGKLPATFNKAYSLEKLEALVLSQVELTDYLEDYCGVVFQFDGLRRLLACCPFHQEDTPSFKVMQTDRSMPVSWRCYGGCACDKIVAGTVIEAAMRKEELLTRKEAVKYSAKLYGVKFRASEF